jgi:hypothetical protein
MLQRMPYVVLALSLAAGCTAAALDEPIAEEPVASAEQAATLNVSINASSANRSSVPTTAVPEQPKVTSSTYALVASNDLGMHCGDVDHRVASILPPFNVIHAQPIKKGTGTGTSAPKILDTTTVDVYYSAASSAVDPALSTAGATSRVFKTNFWDVEYAAYNPYYPPNVLSQFSLAVDMGLPVPDVERLYLGDGALVADQQAMPGVGNAYTANVPQKFSRFYTNLPFFINPAFNAFNYTQSNIRWFAAEGVPISTYDDVGRTNSYPLARLQAKDKSGNTLVTTDVVLPVSGESSCWGCHTASADGGNGTATSALANVATAAQDPLYGTVPSEVSREYAADLNILRIHDLRTGTTLEAQKPISCQKCHYTPALDLAQVGPLGPTSLYPADTNANGREQRIHASMSHVMHSFHASKVAFPAMPPPTDSRRLSNGKLAITTFVQTTLEQSCYSCHPGKTTKCLRGAMFNGGMVCQDCHGDASKVGNDFSKNVSKTNPNAFVLDGSLRVPWANVPRCQSCHTGDAVDNLGKTATNVVKAADGIRFVQAYYTNDANAVPITATNRRFAENQTSTTPAKQMLFRVSEGHGGVFCEGCHGATHAEWANANANANDNVAATQIQGHSGKIVECTACHVSGSLPYNTVGGPHGMHQVAYQSFYSGGHGSLYRGNKAACKACHGTSLTGTPLSKTPIARTLNVKGTTKTLAAGEQVRCDKCHNMPSL